MINFKYPAPAISTFHFPDKLPGSRTAAFSISSAQLPPKPYGFAHMPGHGVHKAGWGAEARLHRAGALQQQPPCDAGGLGKPMLGLRTVDDGAQDEPALGASPLETGLQSKWTSGGKGGRGWVRVQVTPDNEKKTNRARAANYRPRR